MTDNVALFPRKEAVEINTKKLAGALLDAWEEAHRGPDVDYGKLKRRFVLVSGAPVWGGEAEEVHAELIRQRKERGWYEPDPKRIDPGIEGAIYSLWLAGLREQEQQARL
jgi:hypothetical protein